MFIPTATCGGKWIIRLRTLGKASRFLPKSFSGKSSTITPRIEGVSESCSYFRYLDGGGNEYIFDYTADRIEGEDGTVTYTNGRYYCPRLPRCKLSFGGAYAYLTYESGVYKAFSGRFLRFIKDPNEHGKLYLPDTAWRHSALEDYRGGRRDRRPCNRADLG